MYSKPQTLAWSVFKIYLRVGVLVFLGWGTSIYGEGDLNFCTQLKTQLWCGLSAIFSSIILSTNLSLKTILWFILYLI